MARLPCIVVAFFCAHTILFGLSIRHKCSTFSNFRLLSLISLSGNSENITEPITSVHINHDSSNTLINKGLKNLGNTCYMNSVSNPFLIKSSNQCKNSLCLKILIDTPRSLHVFRISSEYSVNSFSEWVNRLVFEIYFLRTFTITG